MGLPLDTWATAAVRREAVTAAQIRALAQRTARSAEMPIVITGGARRLVPQLEAHQLGAVRVVR